MAEFIPDAAPASAAFTPDAEPTKTGLVGLAKELPGRFAESAKKTGRVALGIDEPKDMTDAALQVMTTAPITAGGGALLKAAPWLGRVLASAGIGAGQATARGESSVGGSGKGALGALTAETLASLLGRGRIPLPRKDLSLWESGTAARAFDRATKSPADALENIRAMLPVNVGPWMNVPAISGTMLTPDQAVKGLVKLEGNEYRMAYEQIVNELNALGKSGFGKKAGDFFREFTSESRFQPPRRSQVAEKIRSSLTPDKDLTNPPLRAGLDALSSVEKMGVPIGPASALGLLGASPESLGSIVSRMGRH